MNYPQIKQIEKTETDQPQKGIKCTKLIPRTK